MDQIILRRVLPADIELLQKIGRQTFIETFSAVNTPENMQSYLAENFTAEKLLAELADPGAEFYFAEMDQGVIGYLKINTGQSQTELKDSNGLEIERIYVLMAHQGKKVGQFLFDKALAIARERKADYAWLGVWEENHKAIGFYTRNGFEVFDRHIFKLGDDAQTDLMMKLDLS